MRNKNRVFQICVNGIMIFLCIIIILPIWLLVASSFTSERALLENGYSFFVSKVDFTAYRYILVESSQLIRGYFLSAVVTIIGTLLNLVLTTLYAYPLMRKDLPGRKWITFYLFFTMLFNGGLIPSYIMWTQLFHIKNTLGAYIFPFMLLGAFNVIMMRTFLTTNVPQEIIEAGKIDGAGEYTILTRIVVPISTPVLATLGLMTGLGYWNNWTNGLYFINKEKLYTTQVLLNRMLMDSQFLLSEASKSMNINASDMPSTALKMAIAVMGVLPIIVVYPFLQKYLVKGISVGAVKG